MICAFLGFTFFKLLGLSLLWAFILTLVASIFLGIITERLVIRPAMRAPHFNVFIITLGLSIVMKSVAGFIWGHDDYPYPTIFPNKTITALGATIDLPSIGIILSTIAVMLILFLFFKFTRYGIAMRAVSESQNAALLMGINVKRSFSLTWIISYLVAAVAGLLMAPIVFLSSRMGIVVINGFAAAILGGWGSIPGAIIGGMLLGILDNIAPLYLPAQIKDMIPFMIIFAVLVVRPKGIMGIEKFTKV